MRVVGFELLANAGHVHPQVLRLLDGVRSPDRSEELLPRARDGRLAAPTLRPASIRSARACTSVPSLRTTRRSARSIVKSSVDDRRFALRPARCGAVTARRPSEEFLGVEWQHHVVVGARIEALDLVVHGPPSADTTMIGASVRVRGARRRLARRRRAARDRSRFRRSGDGATGGRRPSSSPTVSVSNPPYRSAATTTRRRSSPDRRPGRRIGLDLRHSGSRLSAPSLSSARLSSSTFTAFSPRNPSVRPSVWALITSAMTVASGRWRGRRRRAAPAGRRWRSRCRGRARSRRGHRVDRHLRVRRRGC